MSQTIHTVSSRLTSVKVQEPSLRIKTYTLDITFHQYKQRIEPHISKREFFLFLLLTHSLCTV